MTPAPFHDDAAMVDAPIDVSDVIALGEQYGPVRLTVLGLPSQARLTAGRLNPDGSWTVGWRELSGVAVRAPRNLPEFQLELLPELEDGTEETESPDAQPSETTVQTAADTGDAEIARPAGPHRSWVEGNTAAGERPAQPAHPPVGVSWVDILDD